MFTQFGSTLKHSSHIIKYTIDALSSQFLKLVQFIAISTQGLSANLDNPNIQIKNIHNKKNRRNKIQRRRSTTNRDDGKRQLTQQKQVDSTKLKKQK